MYRQEQLTSLLADRRLLIAGYGREGRSSERLIRSLLPQADITIADGSDEIAHHAGKGYDLVIKSPGVPLHLLGTIPEATITSQTDLFLQVYADLVIGVTGTKGKSTTASLIHHLLPGSILAGNIGIPLFDIIPELSDRTSCVVAELSCHQLEVLHRSPHIALLLNLFQEHLDHYADYHAYQMAKMQIGLHQQPTDHLFYCTDNSELDALVNSLPMPGILHPYSSVATPEEDATLTHLPLEGEHFRSDAIAACRIASLVAASPVSAFSHRLATFVPLSHRLQPLGIHAGISWYDDSISTIPEATIAAVKALHNVGTLILGGFDRGIDYSPLVNFLRSNPIPNIVFVGKAGRRIASLLGETASTVLIEDDYTTIVPWCAKHTPQGSVCLLSPAAASYDAFINFEERGDRFSHLIHALDD